MDSGVLQDGKRDVHEDFRYTGSKSPGRPEQCSRHALLWSNSFYSIDSFEILFLVAAIFSVGLGCI